MLKNLRGFVLLDGAMGTMLQASGVEVGKTPELLCITHPEVVTDIHCQYINAGCDILYTNTLCANGYKLKDSAYTTRQVIDAAVACAKQAVVACDKQNREVLVAVSVGPIGELLEPNGSCTLASAYEWFKEVVVFAKQAGADLVVFETMTDLLELKTAVLAAKEHTDLPVFCSMSFEENGRTFTGVTVESMALTLGGLGIEAIGINCSLGPAEIFPLAKRLKKVTALPVFVKANAGLPNLLTNTFDLTPQAFVEAMTPYLDEGIGMIGGCCGTTPAFIQLLRETLASKPVSTVKYQPRSALCSATHVVWVDGVCVIGERINPTGKKRFKDALKNCDMDYILTQGLSQIEAGARVLDVNVGLPDLDEQTLMVQVVMGLQAVLDAPLQIDSPHVATIEAALRVTNGKAIVNSVNGELAVMERILPLVKKYGAAVVGLTLDENGIPPTAKERLEIAKRITEKAQFYGIAKEDIYIDCLTLTASAQQAEVIETLKAITLVKQTLGVKTLLGVSNISFGLPNRSLLNHSFLTLAMAHGLDCPILNPNETAMMDAIDAFRLLYNHDVGAVKYIQRQAISNKESEIVGADKGIATLAHAVKQGLKEQSKQLCQALLTDTPPMEIVNTILIPALDEIGIEFETGVIFLPQLLQSAAAAQIAFEEIRAALAKQPAVLEAVQTTVHKSKIVLATVKGDVHDIGKNIVKVILSNYGYEVVDLGKDVPINQVLEAAQDPAVALVGLSALMTTTVVSMADTIKSLKKTRPTLPIMVGGAVLTADYAKKIGADFYAKDAKQAVDIAKKVIG